MAKTRIHYVFSLVSTTRRSSGIVRNLQGLSPNKRPQPWSGALQKRTSANFPGLIHIGLATKTKPQRFKVYDAVLHRVHRQLGRNIVQYENRATRTVHQPRRPKIAVHNCPEMFPVVLRLGASHRLKSLVPKLRQDGRDCEAPSMV